MPDILLGVIIGGLIASISPIIMIIFDHRRWQRQAALQQRRLERKRLEKVFRENLKRFSKAISENSYPSDMIMDFILNMPGGVSTKFEEFLANPNKTDATCKKAYINVVSSMKKSLADIDHEIERIISKKPKII
jgi:type II secretory pathway pseudopilin PulG